MSWLRARLSHFTEFLQSHSEGLLLFFVLGLGGTSIALGATSLRRSVAAPFLPQTSGQQVDLTAAGGPTDEQLKRQDTDGDGLSDYDELNVYHTSPYLADSDSDGIPDGVEVKNGTDPNCPQGKTCSVDAVVPPAATSTAPVIPSGPVDVSSGAPSVADLRSLLKQTGLTDAQVNALSDDQVKSLYTAAMAQGDTSSATSATPPTSSAPAATTPLTAAQVREVLLKSGIPEDKIKNVPDDVLLKTYQETISGTNKK